MQLAHGKLFILWNVLPNCHESSDWCNCFSRSDSGSHAHTHTDKYSLFRSHTAKCFHRGRWCALFAWLLLFLPNLNINVTHSKPWRLHWLKMAAYLQWFFTKCDRSSFPIGIVFCFSSFLFLTVTVLQYSTTCQWMDDNSCCLGLMYR